MGSSLAACLAGYMPDAIPTNSDTADAITSDQGETIVVIPEK